MIFRLTQDYPPGGPYPCSARPPPRFLGPPIRAPGFEDQVEVNSEIPVDPNGPAVCGLSQLGAGIIEECEPPSNPSPPVIAPGPPQIFRCGTVVPQQDDEHFLPLGAGGPAPPVEEETPRIVCDKGRHLGLGAGGRGNKMPPTSANAENPPAPE